MYGLKGMRGFGDVLAPTAGECDTILALQAAGAPPPVVTYITPPGSAFPIPDQTSIVNLERWMACAKPGVPGGATPATPSANPPVTPPAAPPAPAPTPAPVPAATSTGFDFSAVPWWAWAGGAALAFFALGGRHGR